MPEVDKAAVESAVREKFDTNQVPAFAIRFPDDAKTTFGLAGDPKFEIHIKTEAGAKAVQSFDEYAIALAYLDDDIVLEGDFLAMMDMRDHLTDRHPWLQFVRFAAPMLLGQVRNDNRLTPRHYNHGNDLYFTFLDRTHKLYSQALYEHEGDTLEQAAEQKLCNVWESCRLEPGSRVLDVGAGWGSFSRFAAGRGADVTMLTLSTEQLSHLKDVAAKANGDGSMTPVLSNVYEFNADKKFDAIVLLGVMEHLPQYSKFLRHAATLLRDHGRIYMDFAANRTKYQSSTFSHQHVFEGNHSLVHMPGLVDAVNTSPFEIVTIHNDRHSYFETLRAWAQNLDAAADELSERYGLRDTRIFQLYLWGTAHCMGPSGKIESYRVVIQKSAAKDSSHVGLTH